MVSRRSTESGARHEAELLVGFVNTRDIDEGTDEIAAPDALAGWIARSGAGVGSPEVDPEGHRRVLALRESLRALLRANNGGEADEAELAALREAAASASYRASVGPDGELQIEPHSGTPGAFEARVLLAIERLQALGAWERLKACPADDCQWAFLDTSRNRSRTWCSMEVCGNRSKTRRYRSRRSSS